MSIKYAKQGLVHTTVGLLYDTDCFLYMSEEMAKRAEQQAAALHARRIDLDPKAPSFGLDLEMFAEPYIVHAVCIKTQDRVAIRTTDGKKFIFGANTPIMHAQNRTIFLAQLQWVSEQRHLMEKEQQRLQQAHTSKKRKQEEELVEQAVLATT